MGHQVASAAIAVLASAEEVNGSERRVGSRIPGGRVGVGVSVEVVGLRGWTWRFKVEMSIRSIQVDVGMY